MRLEQPSILLVDDDPSIRSLLGSILQQEGCVVEFARDGEEALKILRRERFTSIFLDLLMPKVNGFEVIQDIRALNPDILPDVAVVTGASDQTLQHIRDSKVCRLLRKPLNRSELLQFIDSCAERHGVRRKLPVAAPSRVRKPRRDGDAMNAAPRL